MEPDPTEGGLWQDGDSGGAGRLMHQHRSLLFPCRKRMREASLGYCGAPHRISRSMVVGGEVFPAGVDGAMGSVAADA